MMPSSAQSLHVVIALWLAAVLLGCEQTPEHSGELPSPDGVLFTQEIYPMLLRDCAFSTCHGEAGRFLRVLGPGRTRLDAGISQRDAMLLDEVLLSYERARSLLANTRDPRDSLLLQKPLDLAAGGQTHGGTDEFGRNVYASIYDERYVTLVRWALSRGEAPDEATVETVYDKAAADAEAALSGDGAEPVDEGS